MAPHLLYVAWGYPPSRGAGMYRALATANAFAAAGWRVTVLTATRDTFDRITDSDPRVEAAIDPRIDVVRIPFDPPRGEPDLRRWSRARVFSPLLWNFVRAWRSWLSFPEHAYGSWRRPLIEAARRIHAVEPVSLVIGTANPNVDFVPGDYLSRRHGIPYVLDYRDTWHLQVYSGERLGTRRQRSARLERRLLRGATESWFVNQPILEWHAREYPERSGTSHVVANGFDPAYLRTGVEPDRSGEGRVIGYLGTIYGPMPLRETLDGWRLARARTPALASATLVIRGRLGHYAAPEPEIVRLIDEYGDDGVRYGGPVSKLEVGSVYAGFDALLLILGRSEYVTSGKVFEYAATGLPIASLHHPDTASTATLAGYPEWFPATAVTAEAFAATLEALAARASTQTPGDREAARAWAQHLSRDEQLRPAIDRLGALVGRADR